MVHSGFRLPETGFMVVLVAVRNAFKFPVSGSLNAVQGHVVAMDQFFLGHITEQAFDLV